MQIDNIQNAIKSNLAPAFNGIRRFRAAFGVDNKGLFKDTFQKKSPEQINLDSIESDEKTEITSHSKIEDYYLDDMSEKGIELKEKTIQILEDNKDLTLDSDKNNFDGIGDREYDIAYKMFIAARNSIQEKENSYTYGEKIPKLFEGFDKEEIADKLSEVIDKAIWELPTDKKTVGTFKFKGKEFFIQDKGSGFVGHVFKIFDKEGNAAAIKCYKMDLPTNNGMTEIATLKQMSKDKVNNVPEFYMGNVADYNIDKNGKRYNDKRWMLYEFIEKGTPVKNEGISWKDWCKKYGLKHGDSTGKDQYIGKYLVDVGGINHENHSTYKDRTKRFDFLKYAYRNGNTTEEIIDKLKESI